MEMNVILAKRKAWLNACDDLVKLQKERDELSINENGNISEDPKIRNYHPIHD